MYCYHICYQYFLKVVENIANIKYWIDFYSVKSGTKTYTFLLFQIHLISKLSEPCLQICNCSLTAFKVEIYILLWINAYKVVEERSIDWSDESWTSPVFPQVRDSKPLGMHTFFHLFTSHTRNSYLEWHCYEFFLNKHPVKKEYKIEIDITVNF